MRWRSLRRKGERRLYRLRLGLLYRGGDGGKVLSEYLRGGLAMGWDCKMRGHAIIDKVYTAETWSVYSF